MLGIVLWSFLFFGVPEINTAISNASGWVYAAGVVAIVADVFINAYLKK